MTQQFYSWVCMCVCVCICIYIYIYNYNYNLKRYMHPYIQSSTIHNNKDMETT